MKRLVVGFLLAAAAPALAKPSAAAIAVGPAGSADVDALQAAATLALLRDGRLAGVDPAERLDTRGQAARAAAYRQGVAKMKAARSSYDNLDLAAAIDGFGEAAQAYASAGGHRAFEAYVQALVWQAACRWVNGDHDAARQELVHVFSEAPGAVLDKSAFPPDLMEEADRDRTEAEANGTVDLRVASQPVGLVSVDGQLQGASPLVVKVPPGRHFVTVSAPGWELAAQRAAGSVDLRLSPVGERGWLEQERRALAQDLENVDRAAPIKQVMERLGVSQLLVLSLEETGGERSLVAARFAADGHVLAFAREPVAAGAPLAEAADKVLAAALARDLPRGAGGKPVTDTGIEGGGFHLALDQHGIALIVGGVGLASVIAGTIFGIVELHDRSGYSATPQDEVGQSQFWSNVGNRNAVVSDVLDIVGAVGLGAGVAIWFWPKGSASAPTEKTDVFSLVPLPGGAAFSAAGRF
ncbi:MAG TPA: PEGA domain-containing protein [Myxococcales bacterium]|nr:PEGA domain-containing protein [Myxococcales bacterium]